MENKKCFMFQEMTRVLMVAAFLSMFLLSIASQDQIDNTKSSITHCLPCSQKFLFYSNLENRSNIEVFVAEDFLFSTSCKWEQHNIDTLLGFSVIDRRLSGEGSHRHIITSIRVVIQSEMPKFDMDLYDSVVIESLPVGVFADPFELQHLVQRGVFSDAAVFGDTNLELPSAISNRSIVEIHKNIHDNIGPKHSNELYFTIEIPLHARYPPLDSKGYAEVLMAPPVVMLRYMPKSTQQNDCSSVIIQTNTRSIANVSWKIPSGNKDLTATVSLVTFASALLSSLLIVFASITYSTSKDFKLKAK